MGKMVRGESQARVGAPLERIIVKSYPGSAYSSRPDYRAPGCEDAGQCRERSLTMCLVVRIRGEVSGNSFRFLYRQNRSGTRTRPRIEPCQVVKETPAKMLTRGWRPRAIDVSECYNWRREGYRGWKGAFNFSTNPHPNHHRLWLAVAEPTGATY
jgi:hypothetical protein